MAPRNDGRLFARLLDEAITAAGTTNARLAEASGVHITQVGRWRAGQHRPGYDGLVLLVTALNRMLTARRDETGADRAAADAAVAGLPALFTAAGYAPPAMQDLAGQVPGLVEDNRGDAKFMGLWRDLVRAGIGPGVAEGMLQVYVDWRDGQDGPGEVRRAGLGLSGFAASVH